MVMFFESIALFAAIIFFIFIHKWICNRDEIITNWPIIGMLPAVLNNLQHINDFVVVVLKHHRGTIRFEGPWLTNTNFVVTSDHMNVHHITSKNFNNYGKGHDFQEIFEIFGGGFLNADSHEWKRQRTMLHSFFSNKSFMIFLLQTIEKKVESGVLPFLNHYASKEGSTQVDLQDIFERFTFDIVCAVLLGIDPHCVPNKFTDDHQLSDIAYEKALPIIEDVIFCRHITPKWLWKLQRWLQIGPEKKYKVAQENLDKFLHECIARCKQEEQSRSINIEEVEESKFYLVKALMKQDDGKGEMSDKFLRDIVITLVLAGNGTISSCLSWFFWLLSTHPLVEAKIVQEIKDNFPAKQEEENWIPSSLEDLDKLVYLHGAICETLRLYPPVPFEHKCTVNDDILPSGDRVGPNTKVFYSLYAMGRMEQTWGEDCMEFKPERWISEKGSIIHMPSYKFIAFNAGPRSCLGKDISLIQMKMISAAIIGKYHIQVVEGHPITSRISIVFGMKHGLQVRVTKR